MGDEFGGMGHVWVHQVLNSPDTVYVGGLWPWWELLWECTNVRPIASAAELGDFCASGAELLDSCFIDELWDDDVADFVELVEEWVSGSGGRHGNRDWAKNGRRDKLMKQGRFEGGPFGGEGFICCEWIAGIG